MSDCNKCKYRNDRCFCPPDRECKAFEKEVHKVKHSLEFESDEDWIPGETGCWIDCPFSFMIKPGHSCVCLDGKIECPFLRKWNVNSEPKNNKVYYAHRCLREDLDGWT